MFNWLFKKKSDKKSESFYKKQRLSKFSYKTYDDYLKSALWKSNRRRFMQSNHCSRTNGFPSCLVCNSRKSLQVHHLTYKRLCNEDYDDLILLCKKCHSITHALLDVKIKKNINLLNAHKYVAKFIRSKALKCRYVDLKFEL